MESQLTFVKSYFRRYQSDVYYSFEDIDISKFSAIVIDTIELKIFSQLKRSGVKLISISPLFELNDHVDLIVSRGKTNSHNPKTLTDIKYAIFKNLQVTEEIRKPRLIYHIGGGNRKPDILKQIHLKLEELIDNLNLQQVAFFESDSDMMNIDYQSFEDFKFVKTDLIITTGGLSLYEAVFSGLRTLNFYLCAEHQRVSGMATYKFNNLLECGTLEDQLYKVTRFNVEKLNVQLQRECPRALNVLKEIKKVVKDV